VIRSLQRLTRLSAVYTFGDIVAKGAAFLLLPLYTRHLAPADYGAIGLAEMIKQVLVMLFSFGTVGAVLRFYYQLSEEQERRRFFGTLWLFLIITPGLLALGLDLLGRPFFAALFSQIPFEEFIRPAIWIAYLNTSFGLIPPNLFRTREQAGRYIAYNLATFALTNCLIVWLVVGQGRGAVGYMQAQLIAAALMAVVSLVILLREVSLRPAWRFIGPLLFYSLPLLPHFVGHWALSLSDRAILERFVSLEQLGIYTLAFQFALVFQLTVQSASNAIMPMFSRAAKDDRERMLLPRVATYYTFAVTALGLVVALGAGSVIVWLTPPAYHAAAALIPWLALSVLCLGLYYVPMHALTFTAGHTASIPVMTLLAAGINVALNLLMVPRYGAVAAAVNSAISYAVLLLLVYLIARGVSPITYELGRVARLLGIAALWYMLTLPLLRFHPLTNLAIVAGMLVLFPLGLLLVGFFDDRERTYLARLLPRLAALLD